MIFGNKKTIKEELAKQKMHNEVFNHLMETSPHFRETQASIKKQDEQHKKFQQAIQLEENGNTLAAIKILENIIYEDGLVLRGSGWPFILPEMYFKHEMYNECWKYLNFLYVKYPNLVIDIQDRIDEMRAHVLNIEGRYKDALYHKVIAYLEREQTVTADINYDDKELSKPLKGLLKKADALDKKSEIIALMRKNLKPNKLDIKTFNIEMKTILRNQND